MKSIFGISNLSVSQPFPMPIYDKNTYPLSKVPQNTTIIINNSIKKTKTKIRKPKQHYNIPQKIVLKKTNKFIRTIFNRIKK